MSVMHGVPFAPHIAVGPGRINAAPGRHDGLAQKALQTQSRPMVKVASSHPVPLWRLFLRMGGWFCVVFFLVSAALTLVSHAELMLAERFDTEGVRTEAVTSATGMIQDTRIELSRLLARLGFNEPVPMPDFSSKEALQAYIGLDIPAEKAAKKTFMEEIVPSWLKEGQAREKQQSVQKVAANN